MVDRNGEAAPGERIQGLEEQKPGVTIARVESELATDVQRSGIQVWNSGRRPGQMSVWRLSM